MLPRRSCRALAAVGLWLARARRGGAEVTTSSLSWESTGESWTSAQSYRPSSSDLDFFDESFSFDWSFSFEYDFNTTIETFIYNDHSSLGMYVTGTQRPAFVGTFTQLGEVIPPGQFVSQTVAGHDVSQRIYYAAVPADAADWELSAYSNITDSFLYTTAKVLDGNSIQSQFVYVDLGGHFDCGYTSSWEGAADADHLVTGVVTLTAVCRDGARDFSYSFGYSYSFDMVDDGDYNFYPDITTQSEPDYGGWTS